MKQLIQANTVNLTVTNNAGCKWVSLKQPEQAMITGSTWLLQEWYAQEYMQEMNCLQVEPLGNCRCKTEDGFCQLVIRVSWGLVVFPLESYSYSD